MNDFSFVKVISCMTINFLCLFIYFPSYPHLASLASSSSSSAHNTYTKNACSKFSLVCRVVGASSFENYCLHTVINTLVASLHFSFYYVFVRYCTLSRDYDEFIAFIKKIRV
jgi:hypothetical protein